MNVIKYDICGQICPSTLLTALQVINEYSRQLSDCEVKIAFKTDNRDAISTIPESAANMGYSVSVIKGDGYYLIEIGGEEE